MSNSTGTSGVGKNCPSSNLAVAGYSISRISSIAASSSRSPSTYTSTSSVSPASIIDRRNKRTSTSSAFTTPPKLPQPALAVSRLHLEADSARDIEEPSLSSDKTPTQANFRHLSSERIACIVVRSHTRHGSICTTTFRLSGVEGETDNKTPTNTNCTGRLSPIQGEDQISSSLSPVRDEQTLPVNGNTELSPRQSYPEVQLSSYRLFTRRMYTSRPLDSPVSPTEDVDTDQHPPGEKVNSGDAAESSDTDDVSDPESPVEPFSCYVDKFSFYEED